MKNIEIILINDFSTDNSLKIIEEYKEEDPRIKVINNEKNRKVLFSKSIGALYANGKYILELDQDDMFISEKAFNIIYNNAEKNNLDLLQFRDILLNNFYFGPNVSLNGWIFAQQTNYEVQPNIKITSYKKYNFLLWGLLIKSDIYKKVVLYLWPIIINYKLTYQEDYFITFFFVILAKKFKYLNRFYLAHLKNYKSPSQNKYLRKKEYKISKLLFYNFIFEYHVKNNPEDIIIIFNYLNKLGNPKELKNDYSKLFKFVFKKIFDYFPYKEKKKYMKLLNLDKFNFQIKSSFKYFLEENEYKLILSFQNLTYQKIKKYIKTPSNPKFSIIIYCKENLFLPTIYSIENQKEFDDFEIILIYDSNDGRKLDYIKKFIKNFLNIKLLNNKKEKGLFYSYCTGIMKSKGEYILTIKSGYTLATENVFYELNKNINNESDILEINLLINNSDKIKKDSLKLYRCSHFKSEINLDSFKFNERFKQIDQEKELIVNKLIKSYILKNIINEYKSFFTKHLFNNYYDEIII